MRRSLAAVILAAAIFVPAVALAQGDAVKDAAKVFEFFRASGVIPALIILLVAIVSLRLLTSVTARIGARFAERRLRAQQVGTVVRFAIYIVTAILLIRSLFKLDSQTVLALTGGAAVTLGFALKDLAASVLAGITILFDRPFQVGDRVTFGSHYGEISAIGLRSVRMTTLDDSQVTIPNNKFLTDVVTSGNAGALDMQIVIDFFIAQDTNVARAKQIVAEAVRTSRFVYLEKPVVVLVNDLIHESYLATRLRAKAYVLDVQYEKAFESDVTERVKTAFASAGIRPPVLLHATSAPDAGRRPQPAD